MVLTSQMESGYCWRPAANFYRQPAAAKQNAGRRAGEGSPAKKSIFFSLFKKYVFSKKDAANE